MQTLLKFSKIQESFYVTIRYEKSSRVVFFVFSSHRPDSHKQERLVGRLPYRSLSQAREAWPRTTVWRVEDIKAFIESVGKDGSHE